MAAVVASGCTDDTDGGVWGPESTSTTAPVERARRFFTPAEAALVEALTARILPGTPDDPGAREAEVVVYIDSLLASGGWGNEPVYRSGPFVTAEQVAAERAEAEREAGGEDQQEGGSPELGTSSFGVTVRPVDAFDRYGEQSMMTPPEVYRAGMPSLDEHANERFGADFVDLSEERQDAVLVDLEDGNAPAFTAPSSQDFFVLLRQHTIEGMFSDPMYGGNQRMVGWELIGWPGAQRAYSPEEMLEDRRPRPPQAMEHLPFQSGRPGPRYGSTDRPRGRGPVLPRAGSDVGTSDRQGGR